MSEHHLAAPLTPMDVAKLELGDTVFLTGEIVTSIGFPTHKRLVEWIEAGKEPPIELKGAVFLHMGNCVHEQDGRTVIDYVNPSTSTRFNAFMPTLIRHFGLSAVGGKGGLDATCVEEMKADGCVYFSMLGGGAPILTQGIREVIETGWDDFIMQFRLTRFRVEDFGPLTVAIDAHGNSTYANLTGTARERLPDILKKLRDGRAAAEAARQS